MSTDLDAPEHAICSETIALLQKENREMATRGWAPASTYRQRAEKAEARVAELEAKICKATLVAVDREARVADLEEAAYAVVRFEYGTPEDGPIPPGQTLWRKLADLVGWSASVPATSTGEGT